MANSGKKDTEKVTPVTAQQDTLETRVCALEELVERLKKHVHFNDQPVSPPNRLANNNPDIMPVGGDARGYAEVRQMQQYAN